MLLGFRLVLILPKEILPVRVPQLPHSGDGQGIAGIPPYRPEQTVRRILGASLINFPEAATLLESEPQISYAVFSRDGRLLFAGCDDGTVRVFDAETVG